jgi:hypothetical protein
MRNSELSSSDQDRRHKLEELIAKQGVAQTATYEHLLGAAADLWKDESEFDRFLEAVKAVRQEKG